MNKLSFGRHGVAIFSPRLSFVQMMVDVYMLSMFKSCNALSITMKILILYFLIDESIVAHD
jgi:hypothetical protein